MRVCLFVALAVVFLGVGETPCEWRTRRVFATEEAAKRHLTEHRNEFTTLADSWLSNGSPWVLDLDARID
jgi:hypothetical protein